MDLSGKRESACVLEQWKLRTGSTPGANYATAISSRLSSALGLRNRGAKATTGLYFLNQTAMTAVLVEVCFVDTAVDAEAYNRIGATGVATAIANALVGEPAEPAPEIPVHVPSHDCQIWEQNSTDAQRWWIRENGDGTISLRNASSYQWLSVPNSDTSDGTRLQVWGGDGAPATADGNGDNPRGPMQKWVKVNTCHEGIYLLASALDETKVMDVNGGSTGAGSIVQLYKRNDTYAQQWVFYRLDDGSYRVVNAGSWKLLDVVGGGV